jgi:large subunit ribosomal protein L24
MEAPIHISNVSLIDPETNKPTRVGYSLEKGKKVRIARKSGKAIG